jgi:hypothetical protein
MGQVTDLWLLDQNKWPGFQKKSPGNFLTIARDLNLLMLTTIKALLSPEENFCFLLATYGGGIQLTPSIPSPLLFLSFFLLPFLPLRRSFPPLLRSIRLFRGLIFV